MVCQLSDGFEETFGAADRWAKEDGGGGEHREGADEAKLFEYFGILYEEMWLIGRLHQRMKRAGLHDSWTTVRDVLGPLQRTSTSFRRDDGRMLHLRKTADSCYYQSELYQAMQIQSLARCIRNSVI